MFLIKLYLEKIKKTLRLLDYESYLFWDELFSNFRGLDIRKELLSFDEKRISVIEKSNPYLQSNISYDEAREKIKKAITHSKIEFITGDIFETKLNKKFNSIWLSNIGTYLKSMDLIKAMIDKMSQNLDDDGKLLISYLYDTTKYTKYEPNWNVIYDLENTLNILKAYNPYFISFIGTKGIKFNDNNIKDSVLIYKK